MTEPSENALDDIMDRIRELASKIAKAQRGYWDALEGVGAIQLPPDPSTRAGGASTCQETASRISGNQPKRHTRSECYPFPDYR